MRTNHFPSLLSVIAIFCAFVVAMPLQKAAQAPGSLPGNGSPHDDLLQDPRVTPQGVGKRDSSRCDLDQIVSGSQHFGNSNFPTLGWMTGRSRLERRRFSLWDCLRS